MAMPDYAQITGKTVAHVKLETERRQNRDDVQDVQEIEHAMSIYFTDGSSLRVAVEGEDAPWPYLDYAFTPGRPRAAAVPKRPTAKKKTKTR